MNHLKNNGVKVRDVVCGMFLDLASTSRRAEYKKETYYFCSDTCEKTFTANPQNYAMGKSSQHPK